MKKSFLVLVAIVSGLSGCASMDHGASQQFMVFTHNDLNIPETVCHISNEEGIWTTRPIAPITINRDGNPLVVSCANETQMGVAELEPRFYDHYVFQDLMLGFCLPSCLVDGATNAFYQYPAHISVDMKARQE
jgi:hypothetical protein